MWEAKGRSYRKLHDKVLNIDILSSNPIPNAKKLKQQDEKVYLRGIEEIKDYLFSQIKKGDYVAWSLYYVAYQEELDKIPELSDWRKTKLFLETHKSCPSLEEVQFYSPEVRYYAEVLGSQEHVEEHNGHP